MDIFQNLLNRVRGAYKEADRRSGGWLPGGGVASPLTRTTQELTKSITPTNIRNNVVVPVLDRGIATGIIPTAPGMFARYLTGTNKPLTEFPSSMHQGVRQDLNIVDNQIPKYAAQTHPYGAETPTGELSPTYFSLGRYELKDGNISDRYDFNWLKPEGPEGYKRMGETSPQGGTNIVLSDDPIARTALNFALDRGIINPSSGYNIRVPLR
jgi:hypothetical protein